MSTPRTSHLKWWRGFTTRHPEIIFRTPENLKKARRNLSETIIRQWFSDVKSYLIEKNLEAILNIPARMFNFDETSILLNAKCGKVVAISGLKHCFQEVQNKEKECITIVSTVGKTLSHILR